MHALARRCIIDLQCEPPSKRQRERKRDIRQTLHPVDNTCTHISAIGARTYVRVIGGFLADDSFPIQPSRQSIFAYINNDSVCVCVLHACGFLSKNRYARQISFLFYDFSQ